LHHVFDHYAPVKADSNNERNYGVLISNSTGKALAFALFNLQDRGRLLVAPGAQVYEGQIVGRNRRENDLTVNPIKGKQLTNIRASGSDEKIRLTPALELSLEQALEFIADDELVEITPAEIRLRKRHLKEYERKRASRSA
jgi:GTP-binding protein